MVATRFNEVIGDQIQRCKDTLIKKGEEYATEDKLHNFHAGAGLCQRSPEEVCASFMLKHIVSIYDMCRDTSASSGEAFPLAVWDEKLGDAINYLLLLRAIVQERYDDWKAEEYIKDAEEYIKDAKVAIIDIREGLTKDLKDYVPGPSEVMCGSKATKREILEQICNSEEQLRATDARRY